MSGTTLLVTIQRQAQFTAQKHQLLLLQVGHRHPPPALTGLSQRREDQLQARLLRGEVRDHLGAPATLLKRTLQRISRAHLCLSTELLFHHSHRGPESTAERGMLP